MTPYERWYLLKRKKARNKTVTDVPIFKMDFVGGDYGYGKNKYNNVAAIPGYNFARTGAVSYASDTAGKLIAFQPGVPRITNRGLLIEEARTNILFRSQEFESSFYWSKVGTSWDPVSIDAWVAPDGTQTADLINLTGTLNDGIYQPITGVTPNAVYTFSTYIKFGTFPMASYRMAFYNSTIAAFITSNIIPTYTPVGSDGWYRASVTMTVPDGCTDMRWYIHRTANIGGSFSLWGAQGELGSFMTSLIYTQTTTGTRAFDNLYITGFSAAADFTVGVRGELLGSTGATQRNFTISWGGTAHCFSAYRDNSNNFIGRLIVATAPDANTVFVAPSGACFLSSMHSYAASNGAWRNYANGITSNPGPNKPGLIPMTRFDVGSYTNSTTAWNGYIREVYLYTRVFSNAEGLAWTAKGV